MHDGLDIIQERDAANAVKATLYRDGNIGGILAGTVGTTNYFYHYDGSGNVTQLTNASQSSVAEYSYDAYGVTTVTGTTSAGNGLTVAVDNPYRYQSKEYHGLSGLYDFGYRHYSPGLGRWINRDPIRENGGLNLYGYVANTPVNAVDPYGLSQDPQGSGTTVRLSLARFIPMAQVTVAGETLQGDNRGYSWNSSRFRTQQDVRVDLKTGAIELFPAETGVTHIIDGPRAGYTGQAESNTIGTCAKKTHNGYEITLSLSSGVPSHYGFAPEIRHNIEITLDNSGNVVSVLGGYTAFPAIELWTYRNGAAPQLVLSHNPAKHGISPHGIRQWQPVSRFLR